MKKDIKKNNNKKKGFTLIELLVIILILSIVVGFSYYVITSSLSNAKENTYLTTKTNIEKIASSYVLENSGKMFFTTKEGDTENEYQCITVGELVDSGYFKEDVYNSLYAEGAKVNSDNGVIIVRDKSNKVIKSSRFNATSECNDIRTSRGHNISHTEEFTIKDGRYGKKVTIYYEIRNYDRIDNVKYGYKIGSEDDSNYFRTLKEIKEIYVYDDTEIKAYIESSTYPITIKLSFDFNYNLDGGVNYIGAPSTYKYGVETIINGTPTKSGYTFNGWKNTTDNTGWAFLQKITKGSTGEKTISAKWCQNCKNVTGGSCSLNAETAGTCTYTTSCNTGYKLTSGANTYNPVCTAKKYNISYTLNGGTNYVGAPTKYTYSTGTTIDGTPTKNGYTFNGWKNTTDNTGWSFSQTIGSMDLNDKTFEAKWCRDCVSVTNGKCTLNAKPAGRCTYTTSCNTGYKLTSGANAYNPVCEKSDITPPTCSLSVNGSGITMSLSDDSGSVPYYGLTTSSSPSYNGKSKVDLSVNTFYGYVKDESGNTGSCSVIIKNTTEVPYCICTRQSDGYKKGCTWSSGGWNCGNTGSDYWGMSSGTNYNCDNGYTKINSSYCYKIV